MKYVCVGLCVALMAIGCGDDPESTPPGNGGGGAGASGGGGGSGATGGGGEGGTSGEGGGPFGPGCAYVGSCDRIDGSGCLDVGGSVDAATAEQDCEEPGEATWSTTPCDTQGSVGGCSRENAAGCTITWLWPPATETILAMSCPDGTIVH
jgi:hypothetical protein